MFQDYSYNDWSAESWSQTTTPALIGSGNLSGSSVYASNAKNYTGTVTWKYARPEDMLFDFNVSLYGNRVDNDQIKTYHYSHGRHPGALRCW